VNKILDVNTIKYNKIWLTKDKYIYRASLGEHWYLKKFIVLYKIFLVDRKKIDRGTFDKIALKFMNFINSYEDEEIRKDAIKYFFSPVDFRESKNIIDFQKFNDVPKYDDAARKYYMIYLMKIGMKSGIKKAIGDMLYSDSSITISKIRREIPKIKKEGIENKKKEGKTPRSVNDSVNTIFSDFHAEIRNYRQLLSYWGILPPEEDGYELNEISKLIDKADPLLLMAIWEHQKIKIRYNNPYTRPIRSEDPENKYRKISDFEDFSVNPYIALIEVMYKLLENDPRQAYLLFEDYKYFLCRESPFDSEAVINKILAFRKLDIDDKNKIRNAFDKRPKTREFSKHKKKSTQEDFLKELSNLTYGICEYQYTKNKGYYVNILRYKKQKLEIVNVSIFKKYAKFLLNLKEYLYENYSDTYKNLSNYNSLKIIDEIYENLKEKKDIDETYLGDIKKIRAYYLKEYGTNLNNFYDEILVEWKKYISHIDYKLLVFTYSLILATRYYKLAENGGEINQDFLDSKLSDLFINFIGIKKYQLKEVILDIIRDFFSEKSTFIKVFDKIKIEDTLVGDDKDISKWLESKLKLEDYSYSVIKQKIRKEDNDLLYITRKGERIRKRNSKMMLIVQKERMEKKLIMGKYRPNYPVDRCDCCNETFKKGEPECHHIIPFEIYGPDIFYNYVFLCKRCHNIFTHKTLANKRRNAINNLKKKGIIKKEYFKKMIEEDYLKAEHLRFLLAEGYIHVVTYIELLKMIKTAKIYSDKLESFFEKTGPSENRWNRAMKIVFWYRMKYNLVMQKVRSNYPVESCDGCGIKFKKGEPECHHIIPKKIKGPESPYNYAYLCKECHKQFTHNYTKKADIITNLRKNEIVTFETIEQMILDNEITDEHLEYLFGGGYITRSEYNKLKETIDYMKSL